MVSEDVEGFIRNNCAWVKLPKNVKQLLGNSQKEYEKQIVEYSVKNQLRHKGNLVRFAKKNEEQYYDLVLQYSREHYMLYPYHLSDVIVRGLRITPFQYYVRMMEDLMSSERSYDSLPNFTAADCLRLLGIGRNQYIDLMNQCRSTKRLANVLRRKPPVGEHLPTKPKAVKTEPWWLVHYGCVMENDVQQLSSAEKVAIDKLMDDDSQSGLLAGSLAPELTQRLYEKGLVYFDVPVLDDDYISVPTLDSFVMNRVLGDYFESLLYKVFPALNEHTTVAELANVLQIDLDLVKNAVSVFLRLGIARKKNPRNFQPLPTGSWKRSQSPEDESEKNDLVDLSDLEPDTPSAEVVSGGVDSTTVSELESSRGESSASDRTVFLCDSTVTAFLMMGNLPANLKSHAVTLFEVGKLANEALDNFLDELAKVLDARSVDHEAERYIERAIVLRETICRLRQHSELDLMRGESLSSLDAVARCRVLQKNYKLLVSMAPLSNEMQPVCSVSPPHIGPPIAEANCPWFKLFLYHATACGPTSLVIAKGTRLRRLPSALRGHACLLMSSWSHDAGLVHTEACLPQLNDALQHTALFLQGFVPNADVCHVPFSVVVDKMALAGSGDGSAHPRGPLCQHPSIIQLAKTFDLSQTCGYFTLIKTVACDRAERPHGTGVVSFRGGDADFEDQRSGVDPCKVPSSVMVHSEEPYDAWKLYDCVFGIPLFDSKLNTDVLDGFVRDTALLSDARLNAIRSVGRKVTLVFLDFISQFQDIAQRLGTPNEAASYPTVSLLFDGHRVSRWNGV